MWLLLSSVVVCTGIPYSVLRYGTVTTRIPHRLSTPPPHAMCKRVPSNHVQSCSTMFNHAKCSLTPRPKTLYALFMYRSRPHAPNVYSSNTVLSADHSLYNEHSRCLSNPYMVHGCRGRPRPRLSPSFDRQGRDELGRGGQVSGPPEPPRPHGLEIADKEDKHELDTGGDVVSVLLLDRTGFQQRTAPWSSSGCPGPAGP